MLRRTLTVQHAYDPAVGVVPAGVTIIFEGSRQDDDVLLDVRNHPPHVCVR